MKTLRISLSTAVGLLVLAMLTAPPAAADFVINDDLIVDGSACIGFDCVNGESFGFDTIRLKENNLRIRADDTSVAASYPREDWQIVFNDSANGGTSRFAVEDLGPIGSGIVFTLEAGAGSNALYVDDGGRVGFGTSTPSVELHTIDGDTPALRLQQDGSSGFAPQTWDIAGNETNFFIRDVTNGSALPLRIRPGAATNSIFIDNDDDVGLGTSSPDGRLDVQLSDSADSVVIGGTTELVITAGSDDTPTLRLTNDTTSFDFQLQASGNFAINEQGTGGAEFLIDENASGGQVKFQFSDPAGIGDLFEILANGNVNNVSGSIGTISDRNLKTDITPVDASAVLAKVADLPISTWRFKHQEGLQHMGPMAQDFWSAFGLYEGETTVSVTDLAGVALAAIQGLNREVEAMSRQVEAKDAAIRLLMERVAALEAAMGATP